MKDAQQLADRFAGFIDDLTKGRQIPSRCGQLAAITMGFYAKTGVEDFEEACQQFERRLTETFGRRWVSFTPTEWEPTMSNAITGVGPVVVVAKQTYDTLKGQWHNEITLSVAVGEETKRK